MRIGQTFQRTIQWLSRRPLKKCLLAVVIGLVLSWAFYGLFGFPLIKRLYQGDSIVAHRFMANKAVTPLQNYLKEADSMMLSVTFWTLALIAFLVLSLRSALMPVYAAASILFVSSAIVLSAQLFPPLSDTFGLAGVEYYGDQKVFMPDTELAFKERPLLHIRRYRRASTLLSYGIDGPDTALDWQTDEDGFRNSPSAKDSDIVVIGDGMTNSGSELMDSFSQRLEKHLPGLSVRNLGTGGYGPFQYLRVLERYGLKRRPKYAFFSFNEGNDIGDITLYLRWKSGTLQTFVGGYEIGLTDPYLKFRTAYSHTRNYFRGRIWELAQAVVVELPGHNYHLRDERLARVRLPTEHTFPMLFIDHQNTKSKKEITSSEEWQQLRNILVRFKTMCSEHGITPGVLLIPTAAHIYAEYSTDKSGMGWLEIRDQQIKAKRTLEDSLDELSQELGIPFLSLSPTFESAAERGEQLYDSFSVHMTSAGAEAAATYVADRLKNGIIMGREKAETRTRSDRP
jgi:hypothetical protein